MTVSDGLGLIVRAAQTDEMTETDIETEVRTARPWNVIVHDDPVTLMNYVTQVFIDVFSR